MLGTEGVSDSVDDRPRAETMAAALTCPRCGLTLAPRFLAVEYCPRCIARARRLVSLLSSASP
jgi:hypothetical protein